MTDSTPLNSAERVAFGQRANFVHNLQRCWNPNGTGRACACGTFCIPCVYARGFELVHGGYKNATLTGSSWPPEWPQSFLGFTNCLYWPNLAAYEATHDDPDAATSGDMCVYCAMGLMPCFYFQPCQIAGEIGFTAETQSSFM